MPYIKKSDRKNVKEFWGNTVLDVRPGTKESGRVENAGQLNYVFTCLIIEYIVKHGLSYQIINDIMGALEGCKQEFYRRIVNKYEDKKIKENGDVYDTLLKTIGGK